MISRVLVGGLTFLISSVAFAETSAVIDVTLSPAGSYKAVSKKVTGSAVKTPDGGVKADNITVDVTSITTGIALRDKHTKEHLKASEFPQAKLLNASGKDGKGKATVEIMGQKKDVTGTYEIKGGELLAKFDVVLSDLGIKGVKYMGVGVKDKVTVNVTVPLKAK